MALQGCHVRENGRLRASISERRFMPSFPKELGRPPRIRGSAAIRNRRPRTSSCSFCGHSRTRESVLVAEGGEQRRCHRQNQKTNDYPWPKRLPRRLFGRTGTRRQANCCRGGGEIPSYKALGRISFAGDRLLFE